MAKSFRVALLIESSRAYGRDLLRGVAAAGHEQGNWIYFFEERALTDNLPRQLAKWRPDGIIARIDGTKCLSQLIGLGVPILDLFHEYETVRLPGVMPNLAVLAKMAADHLLDRGFQSFAYCGLCGVEFSDLRYVHFSEELKSRGHEVSSFRYPPLTQQAGLMAHESHAMLYETQLVQWLAGLPKPIGVLACSDARAYHVLNACNAAGIRVPDEAAVLGVDNDLHCELTNPSLSSIDPNAHLIGYQAASMLQQLFEGHEPVPKKVFVEPLGVVTRKSTDSLAIADAEVAEAVRFVRNNALEGMSPEIMARHLNISRLTLDRWFAKVLGRSLWDEIIRVRIARARELLTRTPTKIEKIAHMTGFEHVESMARIFKRAEGLTPGQYREKQRRVT